MSTHSPSNPLPSSTALPSSTLTPKSAIPRPSTPSASAAQPSATAAKPPLPRASRPPPRLQTPVRPTPPQATSRSASPINQPPPKRLHALQSRSTTSSPGRENAVSREVFLLTGGATPAPIAPHLPSAVMTAKPSRKIPWIRGQFQNSARKDSLQFAHWTRVGAATDSVFSRFNKTIKMITYRDDEYSRHLKNLLPLADAPEGEKERTNTNPKLPKTERNDVHKVPSQASWTRNETDNLFHLCEQFDMRFPAIHDRWSDSLPKRSINELKDRYYSVARRLLDVRIAADPDYVSKQSLAIQKHIDSIIKNQFDYEYECVRKNQLDWAFKRPKRELREEEETVREARRIEANRRRIHKERQRLAKLLTPTPESAADLAKQSAASPKIFPHRKPITGAFARSTMIYAPVSQSAKVSKRVDSALMELEVGLRPTPTALVVDNFDLLRIDILAFMELARTVQRKEEEVHQLRSKLAKSQGGPPPPAPHGVNLSNKKRRSDDTQIASLFGRPS